MFSKLRRWLIRLLGGMPIPERDPRQGARITRQRCEGLTQAELIECLIAEQLAPHPDGRSFIRELMVAEADNRRLRRLVESQYPTKKDARHAEHWNALNDKVRKLKHEITTLREVAEHRNRQMKAVKYIVYCTACMAGGPSNKDTITEQEVSDVEQVAKRLRGWWTNVEYRRKHAEKSN